MEFHPIADLFPLLEGEDFAALAADVKANGLQQPIVRHEGKILDGRNRYRACEAAGVAPRFTDFLGADPVAFVASANLHRRHLNTSQRAMIGARIKDVYEEQAKERQRAAAAKTNATLGRGKPAPPAETLPANLPEASGEARDQAAAVVNVSPRTLDAASDVLANGVPKLAAMVDRGEVAVSAAADVAGLPSDE
jgi:ParB-like chromosome segregation protein Spo0J